MASKGNSSFWLLVVASFLCLFPLPIVLAVMAARTKIRVLWIVAGVSGATLVAGVVASGLTSSTETRGSTGSTSSNPLAGALILMFMLSWIVGLVLMFVYRTRFEEATIRSGRALPPPSANGSTQRVQPLVAGPRTIEPDTSVRPAAPRSSFTLSEKRQDKRHSDGAGQSASREASVDVNGASAEDLARVGVPLDAANAIVARRKALGGFSSLIQVQSATNLAPHEWSKIRRSLSLGETVSSPESPIPSPGPDFNEGGRSPGRIVDI